MKNNKKKIFIEALEQRIMLDGAGASTALDVIDERSKDIIQNRYLTEEKVTLEELSKKYNVSIERIRQIESKALGNLKDKILLA